MKRLFPEDCSILFVSGNPYLNWLHKWKPQISKESYYNQLGLSLDKKYIMFAPDPLSNVNGIENYNFDLDIYKII